MISFLIAVQYYKLNLFQSKCCHFISVKQDLNNDFVIHYRLSVICMKSFIFLRVIASNIRLQKYAKTHMCSQLNRFN
jgi:hypothetical protein